MNACPVVTAVAFGAGLSRGTLASWICRCGDPTFNTLGKHHEKTAWNAGVTRLSAR